MSSPNPPSIAVVGIGNLRDFPMECGILLSCLNESTASLYSVNAFGWNALHIAVLRGAPLSVINALISIHMDGSVLDVHGRNALHLAARRGAVDIVTALCTNPRAYRGDDDGSTPLHLAVQNNHLSTVCTLLPYSNVNHQTFNGITAIHSAASLGYFEIIKVLLQDGADIELTCQRGWTPVMAACCVNCTRSLRLLLTAGAEPDRINASGRTALMIAASLNNVEVVRILLETGVDINYTTLSGLNALQSSDGNAVTQLLLRYDVDLNGDLNGVCDIYPIWTPEQLYAAPEYDRRGIYTTILCFQRLEHITGPVDMRSLIHPCSRALRMTPRGWFRWDGDTDAGRYRRQLATLMRLHSLRASLI